ncbi:MAG: hypothetical protein ACQES2_10630 [Pseudomonadota bacterium]
MQKTSTRIETPFLCTQLKLAGEARRKGLDSQSRRHLELALGEAMWLMRHHTASGETCKAMDAYQWIDRVMDLLEHETVPMPPQSKPTTWLRQGFRLIKRLLLLTPKRQRRQPLVG